MFGSAVNHPFGPAVVPVRAKCTMRNTAGFKGQVVALDLGNVSAYTGATTGAEIGTKLSHFANVYLGTTSTDEGHICGVLEADAADGAEVMVTFAGIIGVIMADSLTVTASAPNNQLTIGSSSRMTTAGTNTAVMAILLETSVAVTTPAAGSATYLVLFNGISKIGFKGT